MTGEEFSYMLEPTKLYFVIRNKSHIYNMSSIAFQAKYYIYFSDSLEELRATIMKQGKTKLAALCKDRDNTNKACHLQFLCISYFE